MALTKDQYVGVALLSIGLVVAVVAQVEIGKFPGSRIFISLAPGYQSWLPLSYDVWGYPASLAHQQTLGISMLTAGITILIARRLMWLPSKIMGIVALIASLAIFYNHSTINELYLEGLCPIFLVHNQMIGVSILTGCVPLYLNRWVKSRVTTIASRRSNETIGDSKAL